MMARFWTADRGETRLSRWLLLKITLPITVVGVLLISLGAYAAWRVHRLHARGTDILSVNVASIRAAEDFETAVSEIRFRLRQLRASQDSRHFARAAELLPACEAQLEELQRLAATRRESDLADRVARGYRQFAEALAGLDERDDAARALVLTSLIEDVLPNKLLAYTRKYVELNEEQMADSRQRNEITARQLIVGLLLLGSVAGVAGLFGGYGVARGVSRTLVQLSFPIRDVAGKLNEVVGPLTVSADPGFRDLETVLQRISGRVAEVVEQLQQSQREVLQAEQLAAFGQLAAGLAHELRNPLTSMKVIVQSADEPHDLDQRDLEVLQEETARLEQLVQAFLDFARPPELRTTRVELAKVLDQVIALVAPRARRRGVSITREVADEQIAAEVDPLQFRQVILNLLLNAVDAVPNGGAICAQIGQNNGDVVLCVSDNGCGLPEELGPRIFEPFVSTKETGIGLGLSICRRIVEAHGGRLSAANQQGTEGGAVLRVELPSSPRTTPSLDVEPPLPSSRAEAVPA